MIQWFLLQENDQAGGFPIINNKIGKKTEEMTVLLSGTIFSLKIFFFNLCTMAHFICDYTVLHDYLKKKNGKKKKVW